MIEYRDWARAQLNAVHVPSVYDWENMPMSEMANRALAICDVVQDFAHDTALPPRAFRCLEAMAKAMKERYPPQRPRGW